MAVSFRTLVISVELSQGMLVGVHPVSSGTAVHFLSNKMGALAQFSEVTFL